MGRIRQRLDALEKETGQRDGLCTCALRVVYDGGEADAVDWPDICPRCKRERVTLRVVYGAGPSREGAAYG